MTMNDTLAVNQFVLPSGYHGLTKESDHAIALTRAAGLSADITTIKAIHMIQGDDIANALVRKHNTWVDEMFKDTPILINNMGNQTRIDELHINSSMSW